MFKLLLTLMLVLLSSQSWAVTQWDKAKPASGDNLTAWPTASTNNLSILDTELSNYRQGYTLTYSSGSTIVATSGEITVSNSGGSTRLFIQDASNNNITFANIDTGAEASSTTYYVYCGTNSTTAASCTFYISLSSTTPTGVTYYKRLGSFYNDASSNITTIDNDNQIGEFNTWSAKTNGVVYQALTDGFVTAYISSSGTCSAYTDSSNPPTTLRIQDGGNSIDADADVAFPVKAGDYWKTTGCGTVYFLSTN